MSRNSKIKGRKYLLSNRLWQFNINVHVMCNKRVNLSLENNRKPISFIGLGAGVEEDVKIGYFLIFLSQ